MSLPVDTLAAITWEAYTGGDIRLHRPHTPAASSELFTLHHTAGQWRSRPDDLGYVAGLVAAVLDQRAGGIDSGPLIWQPP